MAKRRSTTDTAMKRKPRRHREQGEKAQLQINTKGMDTEFFLFYNILVPQAQARYPNYQMPLFKDKFGYMEVCKEQTE
jgi:hypothetical protein